MLAFEKEAVSLKTRAELDAGTDISAILDNGLISAMVEVGERFANGDLSVPETLRAAQAMKVGMALLKSHLSREQSRGRGVVVIATVRGDQHDIGENLVAMMVAGAHR